MPLADPLHGWRLEAEFRLDDGVVVQGPVTFRPPDGVEFGTLPLTAMRALSLSPVLRDLQTALTNMRLDHWVDALKAGRRPGRAKQDPRVYLLWAKRRADAEIAAPERPIKWLVEKYRDRGYSEHSINEYVREARKRKLLRPAGQPVELTAHGKKLYAKETSDGLD
jgi:hypothetical protein